LAPLPLNVQFVALKVPLLLVLQVTLPVGLLFWPELVSETVTVQLTDDPRIAGLGVHDTLVELCRRTERLVLPVLLVCPESPP
jgi:hypothetical protein